MESIYIAQGDLKMNHKIQIVDVLEEQKSVLKQMIELYEYDFSEFNDQDLNEHGYYGYKYFDHYWTEEDRHPFFILVGGKYAGFVLVNSHCYIKQSGQAKSIAEFFVMRKYRRGGIGKQAAKMIFDKFKGDWEVLQHGNNEASQYFWVNVIDEYTQGEYSVVDVETEFWKGKGITFNNYT